VHPELLSFPTRRSSDLTNFRPSSGSAESPSRSSAARHLADAVRARRLRNPWSSPLQRKYDPLFVSKVSHCASASSSSFSPWARRSEEHTSELQSRENLV